MKLCKKIFLVFLSCVCLLCSFAVPSAAATKYSSPKMICIGKGYTVTSKTTMYGQTYAEKYIELGKNKTLRVNPYTITNNKCGEKKYVRFTVWVYDINTGKRVDNEVCSNNANTTYKNNTGKKQYLSVQVRPYISTTAWKKYTNLSINSYIKSSQYKFKCTY